MDFTGDIARVEPQDKLVRPTCEPRRRNARVIYLVADDRDAVRRIRPGADRADHRTAGRITDLERRDLPHKGRSVRGADRELQLDRSSRVAFEPTRPERFGPLETQRCHRAGLE